MRFNNGLPVNKVVTDMQGLIKERFTRPRRLQKSDMRKAAAMQTPTGSTKTQPLKLNAIRFCICKK